MSPPLSPPLPRHSCLPTLVSFLLPSHPCLPTQQGFVTTTYSSQQRSGISFTVMDSADPTLKAATLTTPVGCR